VATGTGVHFKSCMKL